MRTADFTLDPDEVLLVCSILETLQGAGHPLTTTQLERAIPGKTFDSKPLAYAWQAVTCLRLVRYAGSSPRRGSSGGEFPLWTITPRGEQALDYLRRSDDASA